MRKKLLSLLLALTTVASLGLTACTKEKSDDKTKKYEDVVGYGTGTGINTTDLDYKPADTEFVLVENGKTDYKLLVPDTVGWEVETAHQELNLFFEKSTGDTFELVKDSNYDSAQKYVSLGNTTLFENSSLELSYDEYKEDGFHIFTDEKGNVIINGAEEDGAIFGIYEFLWYNLGVRIYGENEFKIPDHTQGKVMTKAFDLKSVPSFDNRSLGLSYQKYSAITEQRLSLNKNNGKNWLLWCHTTFRLLPPEKYYDEHKDWYTEDKAQLCFTNEEMTEEMIKVVKEMILASKTKHGLLQIGLEDNSIFCSCDNCKEAEKLYTKSGVHMRFINKVADAINPWMKEQFPNGERTIKISCFAYSKVQEPPVVRNADGTYSPVHPSVVAHENVNVMLAPLSADWAHSMVDPVYNANWKFNIEGWQVICKDFSVYSYNNVFDNQLLFMDSWSYVKEQYQMWEKLGAEIVFDQSISHINLPFFELCSYVRSRLLWDTNADVEYYINDFVDNYYKAGAPYVKKYLDLIRTRYKMIAREYEDNGELFHQWSYVRNDPDVYEADNWPKDWMLSALQMFEEGIAHVEATMEEGEEKTKALARIKAESMSPIFLLMDLYVTEMTASDIIYYCNMFRDAADANGITYWHEHAKAQNDTINSLINEWMAHAG